MELIENTTIYHIYTLKEELIKIPYFKSHFSFCNDMIIHIEKAERIAKIANKERIDLVSLDDVLEHVKVLDYLGVETDNSIFGDIELSDISKVLEIMNYITYDDIFLVKISMMLQDISGLSDTFINEMIRVNETLMITDNDISGNIIEITEDDRKMLYPNSADYIFGDINNVYYIIGYTLYHISHNKETHIDQTHIDLDGIALCAKKLGDNIIVCMITGIIKIITGSYLTIIKSEDLGLDQNCRVYKACITNTGKVLLFQNYIITIYNTKTNLLEKIDVSEYGNFIEIIDSKTGKYVCVMFMESYMIYDLSNNKEIYNSKCRLCSIDFDTDDNLITVENNTISKFDFINNKKEEIIKLCDEGNIVDVYMFENYMILTIISEFSRSISELIKTKIIYDITTKKEILSYWGCLSKTTKLFAIKKNMFRDKFF